MGVTVPMPGTLITYQGECTDTRGVAHWWPMSAGVVDRVDEDGVWLTDGAGHARHVRFADLEQFSALYGDAQLPYLLDGDERAVFILSSGVRYVTDRCAWWVRRPRAQEIAGCLNRMRELLAILHDSPFDQAADHALAALGAERTWLAERRAEFARELALADQQP